MTGDAKKVLRCAIYTRKSTEERLEMEFNSLDAQREACEAFILSQRHEGWKVLASAYDDGGFSGGNLERPALKQLLADIRARKADIVVVYKVDRLTRSLSDFSKIVETFDAEGVAFVSVTQQFNTTSSMGRLTLNVLLSFAQFEREVAGERIRDKIAASRRKGMWMGGTVPLGYDLKDQRYVINPDEADQVRQIFQIYIEQRCVRKLAHELARRGFKTKTRVLKSGNSVGGKAISRGNLYYLLNSRTYLGEAVHKGKTYPGQHEPIIDSETWDKTQAILKQNNVDKATAVKAANPSLLAGLVYDDLSNRLTPTHTSKRGARHRYYVAQPLLQNHPEKVGVIKRVPGPQLEGLVRARFEAFFANPKDHLTKLLGDGVEPSQTQRLVVAVSKHQAKLATASATEWRKFLLGVVRRIVVGQETIRITLDLGALRSQLGVGRPGDEACSERPSLQANDFQDSLSLEIAARVKRSGRETKMLIGEFAYQSAEAQPDPMLIKTIVRAHAWNRAFLAGRSTTEIAREANVHRGFVAAVLPLAYFAPNMTEAIFDGRQPHALTAKRLIRDVPVSWADQRRLFGFSLR